MLGFGCGCDAGCATCAAKLKGPPGAVLPPPDVLFDAAARVMPFTPLAPFAPWAEQAAAAFSPRGRGGGADVHAVVSAAEEGRFRALEQRWHALASSLSIEPVSNAYASWQRFALAWRAGDKNAHALDEQALLVATAEEARRVALERRQRRKHQALVVGGIGAVLVAGGLVLKAVL